MTRKNQVAWLPMAAFVVSAAFAQSPAPDAAASPAAPAPVVESQTDVNINAAPASPVPVAPVETRTDVNINATGTTRETGPAPADGGTSTTVRGFDGKTVLIGGALLLGIILIAVAAAGREDRTTVVR